MPNHIIFTHRLKKAAVQNVSAHLRALELSWIISLSNSIEAVTHTSDSQMYLKKLRALTWTSSFLNSSINTAIGYNWFSPSFVVIFKCYYFITRFSLTIFHACAEALHASSIFNSFEIFVITWITFGRYPPSQTWIASCAPETKEDMIGLAIPQRQESTRSVKESGTKYTADQRFFVFYLTRTVN